MNITEKQINYITYLFRQTELYKTWPKTNYRHTDENVDNRDMILYDKIKTLSSWQASELIKELQNENEDMVKLTLNNL